MTALLVVVGAAVGGPLRYVVDRFVQSRHETVFPWGTLAVNLVASFLIGLLTGAGSHVSAHVTALLAVGFCGTLSTFSTLSFETMRLVQDGDRFEAVTNVLLTLIAGVGAAALGWTITSS